MNVTVSVGTCILNITLTQNIRKIYEVVTLPGGHTDYNNVHLSLQGPAQVEKDLSIQNYQINHLGTGFYNLTASYQTTGAQVRTSLALTNGQTQTLNLDLSAPTYTVSGT